MHTGIARQRGASTVLWILSLVPLLGLAALAVDVNNLFVASAELQNAADAGALEGARNLYSADGTAIQRTTVVVQATAAASANLSRGSAAEVTGVEIGHWRFDPGGGGQFTPTVSDTLPDLVGKVLYDPTQPTSCNNLNNACSGEINAVRVVTERQTTPVESFFGRILGFADYRAAARAVAYIGYAGTLGPGEADQPIAVCQEAITGANNSYMCSVGHFIDTTQTARWTDFNEPCHGSSKVGDTHDLFCLGEGNPEPIVFGKGISTNNGQAQGPIFDALYSCWKQPGHCEQEKTAQYCGLSKKQVDDLPVPTQPWHMVLPVIRCSSGSESCKTVVGTVAVNILFVVNEANKIDADAPRDMTLPIGPNGQPVVFHSTDASGQTRWSLFVEAFNLKDSQGNPATWQQKTIYFLPDCDVNIPEGMTSGRNFGIRARVPVLVD